MRIAFFLSILATFILSITTNTAFAAKRSLAVRAELDTFGDVKQDRPFGETAVITGKCRDVEDDLDDSTKVKRLYRAKNGKVKHIGAFYINHHNQKSVCFDELGLTFFVQKNIQGGRVEVNGVLHY